MATRRRRTTRRSVRRTKKSKRRTKKGVRRAAQGMKVTPAQRKKLRKTMRDFERHINNLARKYNQILTSISRW